jgi:hypothetical protein
MCCAGGGDWVRMSCCVLLCSGWSLCRGVGDVTHLITFSRKAEWCVHWQDVWGVAWSRLNPVTEFFFVPSFDFRTGPSIIIMVA